MILNKMKSYIEMSIVPIFIVNVGLGIFAATILLYMTENNVSAWHENLGIDDTRASELYKTNPNDPQIKQWQDAMMNEGKFIAGCADPNSSSGKVLMAEICKSMGSFGACMKTLTPEMLSKDPVTADIIPRICNEKMSTIAGNCQSHPDSLLICEDKRLGDYLNKNNTSTDQSLPAINNSP